MSSNSKWNSGGAILQLRFDPADSGDTSGNDTVGITWIEVRSYCVPGVDLSYFSANWEGNWVNVYWSTSDEYDNAGWEIYRASSPEGPFEKINDFLIPAYQYDYLFKDQDVIPRQDYYYQLVDIDLNGIATLHEVVQAQ